MTSSVFISINISCSRGRSRKIMHVDDTHPRCVPSMGHYHYRLRLRCPRQDVHSRASISRHIGSCGLFVKQNGLEQLPHSLGLFLVVSQDLVDAWPALEGAGEVPIATLIPSSKTLPVLHSISMLFYFDYASFFSFVASCPFWSAFYRHTGVPHALDRVDGRSLLLRFTGMLQGRYSESSEYSDSSPQPRNKCIPSIPSIEVELSLLRHSFQSVKELISFDFDPILGTGCL